VVWKNKNYPREYPEGGASRTGKDQKCCPQRRAGKGNGKGEKKRVKKKRHRKSSGGKQNYKVKDTARVRRKEGGVKPLGQPGTTDANPQQKGPVPQEWGKNEGVGKASGNQEKR